MTHDLAPHYLELSRFGSTRELTASPIYRRLQPEIERILSSTVIEHHAGPVPAPAGPAFRATAWNIERGSRLDGILRVLAEHPVIAPSEVFLLTELDLGMARSANRRIHREIALTLGLNVAFAPSYLSLVKGSGLEYHAEGENAESLHGNAVISRHPIRDAHSLALPPGIDLMAGLEKRLGAQRAVIATIDDPRGAYRAVSIHLDAHSSRRHRRGQMRLLLEHLDRLEPRLPVLLGGDWNTSTYNSQRALYSILGYWRRVLMGVGNVIRNHYPYPDRYFERGLFEDLERHGYDYRSLNQPGGCTFHYDISSQALNTNLGDWVPAWCFWFIRQALKGHGGQCSLKLDWLAARGLARAPEPAPPPRVLGDVHRRDAALSDHDPIVADLVHAPDPPRA